MSTEIGKVVYPACFSQEESYYSVYFPDFEVTGKGFQDLDETIEFASNMLGEIVIDYTSKGIELPKRSESAKNKKNSIYKYIAVDADAYASKARNNGERLFYIQEDLKTAETIDNAKTYTFLGKTIALKKIIIITILASMAIAFLMVLSNISYNHTQEKWQKRIEEEQAAADEYIQQARDDIKREVYKKAQDDLDAIYGLDDIDYKYRYSERNSLYYYAELLSMRSNGAIVDDLYELIDEIEFAQDDEFYEDYQAVKNAIINEYNSAEVKGKLQHYYLSIDDSMTIDKLRDASEKKGFYTETLEITDGLHYLYISEEPSTGTGSGSEINYTYNVDHIKVVFYSDDRPQHKDYFFREKYATVYCSINTGETVFENWNNEYREKFVEPRISKEFSTVEEAMKYANDYEYSESE